nr:hypothetical protein CFP56_69098 [Quercus suber]
MKGTASTPQIKCALSTHTAHTRVLKGNGVAKHHKSKARPQSPPYSSSLRSAPSATILSRATRGPGTMSLSSDQMQDSRKVSIAGLVTATYSHYIVSTALVEKRDDIAVEATPDSRLSMYLDTSHRAGHQMCSHKRADSRFDGAFVFQTRPIAKRGLKIDRRFNVTATLGSTNATARNAESQPIGQTFHEPARGRRKQD